MSKKTDERTTPQELFDELNAEFHFSLDVAATAENAKCTAFLDKETNGLIASWQDHICFMNPPYSNIWMWLSKARRETYPHTSHKCKFDCKVVVCILPCDTSTRWFHDFLWDKVTHTTKPGVQLRFPQGRYKFGKYTTSPKFATIIAVLR
jgi:site-specific DNA-methyltransferase (adenine-specific)